MGMMIDEYPDIAPAFTVLTLWCCALPINFPCQYLLSSASAVSSAAFAVLSFLTVNLISHISQFNYIKWKEVAISSRSN